MFGCNISEISSVTSSLGSGVGSTVMYEGQAGEKPTNLANQGTSKPFQVPAYRVCSLLD